MSTTHSFVKETISGIEYQMVLDILEAIKDLSPNEPGRIKLQFEEGIWSATLEVPLDGDKDPESFGITRIFESITQKGPIPSSAPMKSYPKGQHLDIKA